MDMQKLQNDPDFLEFLNRSKADRMQKMKREREKGRAEGRVYKRRIAYVCKCV